jgi:hypothetical protein
MALEKSINRPFVGQLSENFSCVKKKSNLSEKSLTLNLTRFQG